MRKVLTSPMINARRNPYVLQFLGLAQQPLALGETSDRGSSAASVRVYRPLIVQMRQAQLKTTGSNIDRATSAEHRASMHRHYKSTERQSDSTASHESSATMDIEPQPEPQIVTEQSDELLGPDIGGAAGDGATAAVLSSSASTKLFEDDTSDDDAI